MKAEAALGKTRTMRRSNSRPTIGLLIGRIGDQRYQTDLWPGIADVAEERDANLICFVGGAIHSPYHLDAQRNIVYELAGKENIDGLVAISGTLGHHIGLEALQAFYQRYAPLPIVGTSLLMEGIPSILVDNQAGMREAMVHLVETHGHRRIAFIRGPAGHAEAENRFSAYKQVLEEHDLPFDPALVAQGDFVYNSGVKAIQQLLDEQNAKFDAVMVANDEMALGVLDVLQQRRISVPEDMAVIGFDDVEEFRFSNPPLTTSRQPLYQQGRCAAETLLDLIAGKNVPEKIMLPSTLVIRQSCGCFHHRIHEARLGPVKWAGKPIQSAYTSKKDQILRDFRLAGLPKALDPGWEKNLLNAFMEDLTGADVNTFLPALRILLRQVISLSDDSELLHSLISSMRKHLLPTLKNKDDLARAEDLWHQARVFICQMAQSEQAHLRLQVVRQAVNFSSVSEALMTTFDLEEMSNTIARELPQLGVESCYLCLYEEPVPGSANLPAERSRLVLAYNKNKRIKLETGGKLFHSRQLIPPSILSHEGRYSLMLEPLHFGQELQFGFLIMGPLRQQGGAFREILLSRQISSTLRVTYLLQQRREAEEALKKYSERLEEMVEGRTAELQNALQKARAADKLKSEFVANVNHELRTPLTNLVLYYQLLSSHPAEKTRERLDVIGREIQRLRILIENLLNLSRLDLAQATLHTTPHDLNSLIRSLVEDRQALAVERGLQLTVDLSLSLPLICMDESMIMQAVSNLLTNAINYTPSGGDVLIRTRSLEDSAGQFWAIITVLDSGPGINAADLPHIFERFYRGKASRDTGAPGTGLGLAIVNEVVRRHHGRIEVENLADRSGTIFTIRLPVDQ